MVFLRSDDGDLSRFLYFSLSKNDPQYTNYLHYLNKSSMHALIDGRREEKYKLTSKISDPSSLCVEIRTALLEGERASIN